jgi:D-glycero-D-manno-heptose 1,7-bisphosphate phosphatase
MKAVFLDRDGVINHKAPEGEYISRWEEMEFCPGVFSAVLDLQRAGFKIVVITNQRGIALGKTRLEDLADIHSRMVETFASHGVEIAGVYFCPHDIPENCQCRKPQPGLLLQAAQDHGLDLSRSWMIGDAVSDIEAGKNAGCKTVRIQSEPALEQGFAADITAADLASAARKVLIRSYSPSLPLPLDIQKPD